VNEPHGTGWRARLKNIPVAGKTGTSQVISLPEDRETGQEKDIPYKFRDHAWFVAIAPFEDPEIAVAVVVEHGGKGGAVAAPIAKALLQEYFKTKAL
jgi:penicillin-binding protein 2